LLYVAMGFFHRNTFFNPLCLSCCSVAIVAILLREIE
jgi:hypothetical protein